MFHLKLDILSKVLNVDSVKTPNIEQVYGVTTITKNIKPNILFVAMYEKSYDKLIKVMSSMDFLILAKKEEYLKREEIFSPYLNKFIFVSDPSASYFNLMGYWKDQFPNVISIGIGGTVGKTTTKEMLKTICEIAGPSVFTHLNYNTRFGVAKAVSKLDANTKYLICEMGTRGFGRLSEECKINKPDYGVCLSVGATHASLLGGNINGVAKAESELIQYLSDKKYVLLNKDDSYSYEMRKLINTAKVQTFGKSNSDTFLVDYITQHDGLYINLNILKNIHVNTYGIGNVYNVMAAVTLAKVIGISDLNILEGLEKYKPIGGRLKIFKTANNINVIDDAYNANLDSMIQSLNVLKNLAQNSYKIVVIGDMLELGEHEIDYHEKLNTYLKTINADMIIYVGQFVDLVTKGIESKYFYHYDSINKDNKANVVGVILNHIKPNAWILFKGSNGTGIFNLVKEIEKWI